MNECPKCDKILRNDAISCGCGWKDPVKKPAPQHYSNTEIRESYATFYARMSRIYPEKKHCLVTPDVAVAMIQEARDARLRGESPVADIKGYIQRIFNKSKNACSTIKKESTQSRVSTPRLNESERVDAVVAAYARQPSQSKNFTNSLEGFAG